MSCFVVYHLSIIIGEKLVNFLTEPKKGTKWPKNLPRFDSRQDAIAVCKDLCKLQYLLRSEKRGKGELGVSLVLLFVSQTSYHVYDQANKLSFIRSHHLFTNVALLRSFLLQMTRMRDFDEAGYFTWLYEGDTTKKNMMTGALVLGFLFCVCFPIWPTFLRVFVWYLSVSFLLFIFALITARGFAFLCVWILGWEFWFLPNLFDESLGFVDSFKPVISCEPTKPGQLPYRLGVGVAFFSFCYWAVTQPSEFDGFVSAQGDFLKDLYAGTLLSDMSQEDKENIDKPKAPKSLDELLKDLDTEIEDGDELGDLEDEDNLDNMLDNLLDDEEDIDEDEE